MEQNYYNDCVYPLLRELCAIPAPSHMEEKRAEYCKNFFEKIGYEKVYIDEAKNVICEVNCENSNEITVFAAHTDTVFPDLTPMPYFEDGGKAFCPGVGDDTASVAVLLAAAKYIKDNNISGDHGVLFVCNSCEEGLGNLLGVRELMKNYENRIARFITFDSNIDKMVVQCVGSHRYEVEISTDGGHSFSSFGNESAINHLSNMIKKIYEIKVPEALNSKTTYNVGIIEGGTSVNTIAQSAKMLCEYRSNNVDCLDIMKKYFYDIFEAEKSDKVKVNVKKVGDRPCANSVDTEKLENLTNTCKDIIERIIGKSVELKSGSTDCNIPMSLGIPSVALGVYNGAKAHTREEWIELESLKSGFDIATKLIEKYL